MEKIIFERDYSSKPCESWKVEHGEEKQCHKVSSFLMKHYFNAGVIETHVCREHAEMVIIGRGLSISLDKI